MYKNAKKWNCVICPNLGVVKDRLSSWLSVQTLNNYGGMIGKNCGTKQFSKQVKQFSPKIKWYFDQTQNINFFDVAPLPLLFFEC